MPAWDKASILLLTEFPSGDCVSPVPLNKNLKRYEDGFSFKVKSGWPVKWKVLPDGICKMKFTPYSDPDPQGFTWCWSPHYWSINGNNEQESSTPQWSARGSGIVMRSATNVLSGVCSRKKICASHWHSNGTELWNSRRLETSWPDKGWPFTSLPLSTTDLHLVQAYFLILRWCIKLILTVYVVVTLVTQCWWQ